MYRNFIWTLFAVAILFTAPASVHGQMVPSHNQPSPKPPMWIEPQDAFVLTGEKLPLKVLSIDPADRNVMWTISGDGTIDSSGVYTAPADVPDSPPTVTAISKANGDHKAKVTIIVNASSCRADGPPCVKLEPLTALVKAGKTVTLSARAVNLPGTYLDWTIKGHKKKDDASGGKIEGSGNAVKYHAPAVVPYKTVEVIAAATKLVSGKPVVVTSATAEIIVVARYVSAHCYWIDGNRNQGCNIIEFNRLKGERGTFASKDVNGKVVKTPVTDDPNTAPWVLAVNASKALVTGSVLEVKFPHGVTASNCKSYDWKIVTQTEESPNILIYGPADVGSGICTQTEFVIALPVQAVWADVSGFPQIPDPQRTGPAAASASSDCWGQNPPQTILPCDRNAPWMKIVYDLRLPWLSTNLGQAGSAQGLVQYSPTAAGTTQNLLFDLRADPAKKLGYGWLNVPLTFEKSTGPNSNLDALIVGLAYDVRPLKDPNLKRFSHFIVRKPQAQIQSGVEIAPVTSHDANWISSGTVKFPLVFNWHQQPSLFTVYPVTGLEGGSHFETHFLENNPILRYFVGTDGSFRWPFNFTHNFLGGTPITFEYSYRTRWLAYAEPTTDVVNNGTEKLGSGRHSFVRGTLNLPLTPNFQIQITNLRGSLPPDFRVLGNVWAFGLTLTNPGSSEH